MITYFCNNPMCINHINIRKVSAVKRFRHRYGDNQYLCGTCYNAVRVEEIKQKCMYGKANLGVNHG